MNFFNAAVNIIFCSRKSTVTLGFAIPPTPAENKLRNSNVLWNS